MFSPGSSAPLARSARVARAVLDPFYAVSLVAGKFDECRRLIQRTIMGRRGRARDPLYRVWHTR